MDMLSHASRHCRFSRARLLFLPALSAFVAFNISKGTSEDNVEHPYIEQKEIKSETCLTCHPAKKEGKFVHFAVALGCENCHRATSKDDHTTMDFVALGGDLCARCHELRKALVIHKPYHDGQCLICHNPHASEFAAQVRASVESLCMSCHGTGRPDVRINAKARTVSLLDGRTYDLASFELAPKVGSGHAQISMPPRAGRATLTKASKKTDAAQSCISCHDPHASDEKYLLHKAAESEGAIGNPRVSFQSHPQHANGSPQKAEILRGVFQGGRA